MSIPKLNLRDLSQGPNPNDPPQPPRKMHKRAQTLGANDMQKLQSFQASLQVPGLHRTTGANFAGRISPPPPTNKLRSGSLDAAMKFQLPSVHQRVARDESMHDIAASTRANIDLDVRSLTLSDEEDEPAPPSEEPPPPSR